MYLWQVNKKFTEVGEFSSIRFTFDLERFDENWSLKTFLLQDKK